MRDNDVYFLPLGGSQRIGASCYYLRLGKHNIILDAGIGFDKKTLFEPDFRPLLTSPFMKSLSQIDQIFVSHAHLDHVGYLPKLMSMARHAQVYMTEPTAMLAQYQLLDNKFARDNDSNEDERLAIQYLLQQVVTVGYLQTIHFGDYTATFYQAGHIPGAMMIMFSYGGRNILYTGDYSVNSTDLTGGCDLLADCRLDTIIMCGLHAKHPNYCRASDQVYALADEILLRVCRGERIACHTVQLSKGIEFLKILNSRNLCHIPIYVDHQLMQMVDVMGKLSIPILTIDNRLLNGNYDPMPHILLMSEGLKHCKDGYRHVQVDFTLHEDFAEMVQLLKHYHPRQAVLVHCSPPLQADDLTVEQILMYDGSCNTQFLFAEEKEIYKL